METKIRVGAVSYLNTKPLIYGLENGIIKDDIELITDYPANIATLLVQNKVDIALVPIATIPLFKEHFIVTDYCIATNGEVASVCLFSDVPLEEIKTILLDYQSKSSVGLLKILLYNYWNISPIITNANAGYEQSINGTTAGLVIGDRAFEQRHKNKYVYDLGLAWLAYTGLPFVFAAWVANKKLPMHFIQLLNMAIGVGLQNLQSIIAANPYPHYDLQRYYTQNISYVLDADKRKAIELYLQKLTEL